MVSPFIIFIGNDLDMPNKIDSIRISGSTYNVSDVNLGGFTLVQVTQAQYDALATKDPNTLYIIVD